MIRRKTIRPMPCITQRWTAWASQLLARHGRWTDARMLSMPLYVRLCRTPLLLNQRWLSFHTQVCPRLKLSIAARGVWNVGQTEVYAPQMVFLQSFVSLIQRSLTFEIERKTQRADALPQVFKYRRAATPFKGESVQQVAMTLAIARTRAEHLSSTLHRHHLIRQESEFTEIARRLTQRLQRVNEVSVIHPQMALRKEAPVVVTPKHAPLQAFQEQSSFERRSGPQSSPPMMAPELNVEQLANQVLKQIDRRVIARRERMGQV